MQLDKETKPCTRLIFYMLILLIDLFNGVSTRIGLFHVYTLGKSIFCTFIFTSFMLFLYYFLHSITRCIQ